MYWVFFPSFFVVKGKIKDFVLTGRWFPVFFVTWSGWIWCFFEGWVLFTSTCILRETYLKLLLVLILTWARAVLCFTDKSLKSKLWRMDLSTTSKFLCCGYFSKHPPFFWFSFKNVFSVHTLCAVYDMLSFLEVRSRSILQYLFWIEVSPSYSFLLMFKISFYF